MNTLFKRKDIIFEIKNKVENKDPSLFSHLHLENQNCTLDENTISIVMTSSNRSRQTYFTLKTISNSCYKNVQVIIVDDSTHDPINIDHLKNQNYPFCIDFIQINRANKIWHNPLVNYNIGFQFIKGGKVIIQNAEVCHIGDVINFIHDTLQDDKYYSFDVKACLNLNSNEQMYNSDTSTIEIYNKPIFVGDWFQGWYQGEIHNRNFHFLTALSRISFDKVKCFSYDMTMGTWYDDNDFLLKIISKKIDVVNIFHNQYKIGGVHLNHPASGVAWDHGKENNENLFNKKKRIYDSLGIYVDATENIEDFDRKYGNLYRA